MAVHRILEHEGERAQRHGNGLRPRNDRAGMAPEASQGSSDRRWEEREAVFDIADFAAIADFAGIGRGRRKVR